MLVLPQHCPRLLFRLCALRRKPWGCSETKESQRNIEQTDACIFRERERLRGGCEKREEEAGKNVD